MVPIFYEPEKQPLKELEGSPNKKRTCSNTPTTCSTDMVTHSQATCSTDAHSHVTCSTILISTWLTVPIFVPVQVKWKDKNNHLRTRWRLESVDKCLRSYSISTLATMLFIKWCMCPSIGQLRDRFKNEMDQKYCWSGQFQPIYFCGHFIKNFT